MAAQVRGHVRNQTAHQIKVGRKQEQEQRICGVPEYEDVFVTGVSQILDKFKDRDNQEQEQGMHGSPSIQTESEGRAGRCRSRA